MLVLSVGSPGSVIGPCLAGVGVGVTAPAGVGDESGVCGKACRPPTGVETGEEAGVAADDGSGSCGKACNPASGVETGDGVRTCARSGPGRLAARHPSAIKRLFTGTNLLRGVLVQYLWTSAVFPCAIRGNLFSGRGSKRTLAELLQLETGKPQAH